MLDPITRRFGNSPGGPLPYRRQTEVTVGPAKPEKAQKSKRPEKKPAWKVNPTHLEGKSQDEKRHLLELNQHYAVSFLGSQLRVIWEVPDKPAKFITTRDVKVSEGTRRVKVKGKDAPVSMIDEWLKWPGRRAYNEIRFAPGNNDLRVYNLFTGWAVVDKEGDWSLLRDHIRSVICNGDDEQFVWFMTWLAHMFQRPGEKLPVAVVIRGMKGTGKSIVFDFIHRVMPRYMYKVADGKRALSNFNAQYESTLLLLMEEAFWAGDQAKESILKDIITSPKIAIERKGIDPYMADNYMRVAMISNERWVVPASHDERRYAVFDCGSQHRNNLPYFEAMVEQMDNGGTEAMLHELLNFVPENGWNVLRKAPATSGLKEQVVDSLRGLDRFMYDLLVVGMYECDGCVEGGIFLSETSTKEISLKEFRTAARDYMADHSYREKQATFDMIEDAARDWFGAEIFKRKAHQNDVRCAAIPPLPEVRDHVRRSKGIDLPAPSTIH